mmetsp:Transcript_6886/g.10511  ORF Transcript_6886/g.10511 Transcript_6886/m.10511 type:complete len:153 (+) Transcript_6886:1652-2110(+)
MLTKQPVDKGSPTSVASLKEETIFLLISKDVRGRMRFRGKFEFEAFELFTILLPFSSSEESFVIFSRRELRNFKGSLGLSFNKEASNAPKKSLVRCKDEYSFASRAERETKPIFFESFRMESILEKSEEGAMAPIAPIAADMESRGQPFLAS